MTDETERLARMEEQMKSVVEALERIEVGQKKDSDRIAMLELIASGGRGALRATLVIGGIIAGIATFCAAVATIINIVRHY
jgi:hypothetical protein